MNTFGVPMPPGTDKKIAVDRNFPKPESFFDNMPSGLPYQASSSESEASDLPEHMKRA